MMCCSKFYHKIFSVLSSSHMWIVLTSCDYELQDVDVLNPFFSRDIDETSWKSLSGVRANKRILQLVPDLEVDFIFCLTIFSLDFLLFDCQSILMA